MLRPKDTATRERKALDGLWRFALDARGAGRRERWWAGPLAGAREMPVPASYNDIYPEAALRDHVGDAWYQTRVRVPARLGRTSASSCASTPPRTARSSGSATRRSPSTRAATRRSRPTSPTSWRRAPRTGSPWS